ncbi:MAG: hypothetical protein V1745_03995 [Patescibacteria group bacterium]
MTHIIGGQLEIRWLTLLEREIRILGGSSDLTRRFQERPEDLAGVATAVLSLEGKRPTMPSPSVETDHTFGRPLEIHLFSMLEREIRRQGGSCEDIRSLFHDPRKIKGLAVFILSRDDGTSTTKPIDANAMSTAPSP